MDTSASIRPGLRYNGVAMGLHWLIAALLIGNIGLAWYFNSLTGLPKIAPIQLHKSIGITVLLLTTLRLIWRLVSPPPALPDTVSGWQRTAAGAVYILFYLVMFGLPLTGWALSSASVIIRFKPTLLFGLVHWPTITPLAELAPGPMKQAHEAFVAAHGILGKLAYALITLHVAAAFRHLVLLRDGVVGRMVPFVKAPVQ